MDVLLLSVDYAWAWGARSVCRFVKFFQMSQKILTIGDNVPSIMTIEKDSLLMVAHVKPKVVKPSASGFTLICALYLLLIHLQNISVVMFGVPFLYAFEHMYFHTDN